MDYALNPMAGVLAREIRGDTDTEEEPSEDGGRHGRDETTSPGMPRAPEAGRCIKDPPLEPWEGVQV